MSGENADTECKEGRPAAAEQCLRVEALLECETAAGAEQPTDPDRPGLLVGFGALLKKPHNTERALTTPTRLTAISTVRFVVGPCSIPPSVAF